MQKVILISGGSGYLGSAISHALTEVGYVVVDLGADVTDPIAVEKRAQEVKQQYGTIFGVIHAASASLVRRPILTQSSEEFASQFLVNVTGAFHFIKSFSPLISSGGVIVGITSKAIDGQTPQGSSGSYIPAKHALRGLLHMLSTELAGQGIRVHEVVPAFMPGGLNRDMPEQVLELLKKKTAPSDITTPEEVARTIVDLVSHDL